MESTLIVGLIWTLYGIAGIFGHQLKIPKKYKGKTWTKEYVRFQGLTWLILGVAFLVLYLLDKKFDFELTATISLILCASLPSWVYAFIGEKKFKHRLKNE